MKRNLLLVFGVAFGLFVAATPLMAHHSFGAQYDRDKTVTLTGTVTKVEWMNPHIYFFMDVEDANGNLVNWAFEGGAPNGLFRRGWRPNSLQAGDVITVEGSLAKDGTDLVNASSVVTSDGRRLFAGTSDPEAVER